MAKHDLTFEPPIMNAAGVLGFFPDRHGPIDWGMLGAFITNPISLSPRTPAHGSRFEAYPGGFLLHTGYPNPGLSLVIAPVCQAVEPLPSASDRAFAGAGHGRGGEDGTAAGNSGRCQWFGSGCGQ